ncbi:Ferrous-iron efflux pump FieF [invertebrate metagenome]|uniref:Ferrous-iron efflux pump FieF n=1 Tax=invertebrate metagenome TaxID=1711999 RepID=A0A2H9T731_9ZZZZ
MTHQITSTSVSTPEKKKILKFASAASVATAGVLIVSKIIAWFMTGSLSLFATVIDSGMDLAASFITLVAIRIALTPADDGHPFGHGKAEHLAVLAQSAFIGGSAIALVLHATSNLYDNKTVSHENIGIIVMSFSIIATLILLSIQYYAIKKTNSSAIKADALHYRTDLLVNASVIVALLASHYGYHRIDTIFALVISIYMLLSVRSMAWNAVQNLMDQSLPADKIKDIEKTALSVEGVGSIHEIRTRVSGSTTFIQLHLDINGLIPLCKAHDIGFSAKQKLLKLIPDADIIVHLDPK